MKKILLILFLIPNLTYALPVSLDEYMYKHSTWSSSDKVSLSYIESRCGILLEVISEHYKNVVDAQEIYNMSLMNSKIFSRASSDIYKTRCINFDCIKIEKKASHVREKEWALIYGKEAESNFENYGEIIHGDIKSDFSTCMTKVKPIIRWKILKYMSTNI